MEKASCGKGNDNDRQLMTKVIKWLARRAKDRRTTETNSMARRARERSQGQLMATAKNGITTRAKENNHKAIMTAATNRKGVSDNDNIGNGN